MYIHWSYYTGWPDGVAGNLKRCITQLANNNSQVKIGITNNPERRWREHRQGNSGWEKMIVVYRTTSVDHVRYLEQALVDWIWYYDPCCNLIAGGGGRVGIALEYYLYFLVKK